MLDIEFAIVPPIKFAIAVNVPSKPISDLIQVKLMLPDVLELFIFIPPRLLVFAVQESFALLLFNKPKVSVALEVLVEKTREFKPV